MLDELDLAYEEGQSAGGPGRHRRPKSRRGRSLFAAMMAVVLLGVLGGGGFWAFEQVKGFFTAPDFPGDGSGTVEVQVQTGQGAADIGNTLYSKGVVKSAQAFVDAAKDNAQSVNIQPGFYRVHKQMKASNALSMLLDLKNKIFSKVTIPEGLTAQQTFAKLSDALKIPVGDFATAAKNPTALGIPATWFTRSDKQKVTPSVEGFLYPDTYQFDPGTTATEALSDMVSHFLSNAQAAGLGTPPAGVTQYDVLIIASLAQAEGVTVDFGKISRVVYNRLNDAAEPWMQKLQFDSTTNYWLQLQGKGKKNSYDLTDAELNDATNPYSTTAHAGLPPSPIDSPGADAMKGAESPPAGGWLYFVKMFADGRSAFETTNAQHDADVAKAQAAGIK
jgi:UPF0755 protein